MNHAYRDLGSSGNLPAPLSRFIGRAREAAEVMRLLGEHRLVTLIGPGGSGKTRLALHVAHGVQQSYPDGAWLIEFAPLSEDQRVAQAVATALGVRESAGLAVGESLQNHLQARSALLVLDNCEHLLGTLADLAATLLQACPHLRLLATSREPLGVPGELVWAVPPLSTPDRQPWLDPASQRAALAALRESEAVQLFAARATEAVPTFQLTAENGPWIADICRRLDGLPLAIELAAARMRALSVEQIAERLDDRFHLLTSSLRTVAQRHRALEATFDWSHELLSAAERTAFRRLAVFVGGWRLEAAEAVCAGGDVRPEAVLDLLRALVDKSLVVAENREGQSRYRLLETIREYALQKLADAGEHAAVRDRHLAYYLGWAEANTSHLATEIRSEWRRLFDLEHDNLRAALDWAYGMPDKHAAGLHLAATLGAFWRGGGYMSEGRERLATALALPGAQASTVTRGLASTWAARIAFLQSDFPATRILAETGLKISREAGPPGRPGVGQALYILGDLAMEVGDDDAAPGLFGDALEIFRELGDTGAITDTLVLLGWAAMRTGDYARAEQLLNEPLPLLRETKEGGRLALGLAGLGELCLRQGKLDEAQNLLAESLEIRRESGDLWGCAGALGSLGWVALLRRDFSRTRELLGESMRIRQEIGDRGGLAWCLEKLAEAASLEAQALPALPRRQTQQRAACMLGAASALREPVGSAIDTADRPSYERLLARLRHTLGDTAFDASWAEGAGMPVSHVIDLAVTPPPPDVTELSASGSAKAAFSGLSARERETAALIAAGLSNREIADHMVVGLRTVETYVTRILIKLSLDSRVQIATWAREVGLPESPRNAS
jgi:non-specific serine/threonine protein kinase